MDARMCLAKLRGANGFYEHATEQDSGSADATSCDRPSEKRFAYPVTICRSGPSDSHQISELNALLE